MRRRPLPAGAKMLPREFGSFLHLVASDAVAGTPKSRELPSRSTLSLQNAGGFGAFFRITGPKS